MRCNTLGSTGHPVGTDTGMFPGSGCESLWQDLTKMWRNFLWMILSAA